MGYISMKRGDQKIPKSKREKKRQDEKDPLKKQPPHTSEELLASKFKTEATEKTKEEANLGPLLELRRSIQKRRPKFIRQESWRYKRLETTWRKPKGLDSKMRKQIRGWPKIVKIGYRGPKLTRGLHPSGYRDVLIHNKAEILLLDPRRDAIRLSAKLGRRYRITISNKAEEMGIRILNPLRIGQKSRQGVRP
ncbi:MAG: 50S ribosomal protein L32e [Nitrososphaerales archaeon]